MSAWHLLEVSALHTAGISPAMEHSAENMETAPMSAHAALTRMVVTSAKSCQKKFAWPLADITPGMDLSVA